MDRFLSVTSTKRGKVFIDNQGSKHVIDVETTIEAGESTKKKKERNVQKKTRSTPK